VSLCEFEEEEQKEEEELLLNNHDTKIMPTKIFVSFTERILHAVLVLGERDSLFHLDECLVMRRGCRIRSSGSKHEIYKIPNLYEKH
jgi:hypothetical protein